MAPAFIPLEVRSIVRGPGSSVVTRETWVTQELLLTSVASRGNLEDLLDWASNI